jgi:hypothetical protein
LKRIFVSSVIKGFESFRGAAKGAVGLMGYVPLMSESFGARSYSAQQACLNEVEQSDVVLLILGRTFGFEVEPGVSATQAEFRHAKKLGKPILVFVQEIEMEDAQGAFRREVEDFHSGFFRASFSSASELKDEVVRGLRQLEQAANALSEDKFLQRVHQAAAEARAAKGFQDPKLKIAFLPQPKVRVHLPDIEANADTVFSELCSAGLASLRDGYKLEGGADVVKIESGTTELSVFSDGLRLIRVRARPGARERGWFDDNFVPPSYVQTLAAAAFNVSNANSGWCYVAMDGMQHSLMRERPSERATSISMPMRSDDVAEEAHLFQPLNRPAYETWIKQVVESFTRRFRA